MEIEFNKSLDELSAMIGDYRELKSELRLDANALTPGNDTQPSLDYLLWSQPLRKLLLSELEERYRPPTSEMVRLAMGALRAEERFLELHPQMTADEYRDKSMISANFFAKAFYMDRTVINPLIWLVECLGSLLPQNISVDLDLTRRYGNEQFVYSLRGKNSTSLTPLHIELASSDSQVEYVVEKNIQRLKKLNAVVACDETSNSIHLRYTIHRPDF